MNSGKIALIVDSCNDVPPEIVKKHGIYIIPLTVNYSYGSFRDRVDIDPQYVYDNFEKEIPKTSLPSGEDIEAVFRSVVEAGYEKAVVVTISSGLSGTYNLIRIVAQDFKELDVRIIDTKLIGLAAGMIGIYAARLIESGADIDEIESILNLSSEKSSVYFCVPTLEYLRKGGRISHFTGAVGTLLGILPVITCDKDGIYQTVKKTRGWKNVINSAIECAARDAQKHRFCNIAVVHGGAPEEAKEIAARIKERIPNIKEIFEGQISPALVVHTGPGLIGIGVHAI